MPTFTQHRVAVFADGYGDARATCLVLERKNQNNNYDTTDIIAVNRTTVPLITADEYTLVTWKGKIRKKLGERDR